MESWFANNIWWRHLGDSSAKATRESLARCPTSEHILQIHGVTSEYSDFWTDYKNHDVGGEPQNGNNVNLL